MRAQQCAAYAITMCINAYGGPSSAKVLFTSRMKLGLGLVPPVAEGRWPQTAAADPYVGTLWRRRMAACTTKVINPPAARQAARNSIGAIVLPVASRIHGTTFWAMKPPRLPTELIAARPAAAEAPVRNFEGKLHSTGWGANIPAAAPHKKANFSAFPGTYTLSTRQAAPNKAGPTMN